MKKLIIYQDHFYIPAKVKAESLEPSHWHCHYLGGGCGPDYKTACHDSMEKALLEMKWFLLNKDLVPDQIERCFHMSGEKKYVAVPLTILNDI